MKLSQDIAFILLGVVTAIGIIGSTYLIYENLQLKDEAEALLQDRNLFLNEKNQKTAELEAANEKISELENELVGIKEELEDLADDYRDEKNKNDNFEDQIRAISGAVGDLDKLAKLDEELLQKYSKVYFLNENYIPERVEEIKHKYVMEGKAPQFFHARAIDHLEDMFEAAADDGIDLQVVSAYRSFDTQTELKGQYTQIYGSGANAFSADQGYSEHQLGTTLDITVDSVGGPYNGFADTEAYEWLLDNAYKYGFILSYPEDNGFYIFEPWHWRFVGTELAKHLNRSDETFYTMEQREIDEYLLEIFD